MIMLGKAKSYPDAMNNAFRDAIRNLVHIDLYENSGLAHDLYGKHNSCHAYIRATPTSREMVGSKFATSILQRMGIASASVKLVGKFLYYYMYFICFIIVIMINIIYDLFILYI